MVGGRSAPGARRRREMKRPAAKHVEGLYVYLIGRERGIKAMLERAGLPSPLEQDRPLSLIAAETLAALVSPVPLDQYGEGQFESRLKDPLWAAEKVMRHQTVNAFFGEAGPVAPL